MQTKRWMKAAIAEAKKADTVDMPWARSAKQAAAALRPTPATAKRTATA